MKKITVSVPDDAYRAAEMRAAERRMSVSALVVDWMRSLFESDVDFEQLEARQRALQRRIERFSARERPGRDRVHAREVR